MSTISIDNKTLNINNELEPILTAIEGLQRENKQLVKKNEELEKLKNTPNTNSRSKVYNEKVYNEEATEGTGNENTAKKQVQIFQNSIIELIKKIQKAENPDVIPKAKTLEALNRIKNLFD